jgi:hypothetical protein
MESLPCVTVSHYPRLTVRLGWKADIRSSPLNVASAPRAHTAPTYFVGSRDRCPTAIVAPYADEIGKVVCVLSALTDRSRAIAFRSPFYFVG